MPRKGRFTLQAGHPDREEFDITLRPLGFAVVRKVLPERVHPSMDGYLSVGTIGFEASAVEAVRAQNALLAEQVEQLLSRLRRSDDQQGQ